MDLVDPLQVASVGSLGGIVVMHVDVLLPRVELERIRVRSRLPVEADRVVVATDDPLHVPLLRFSVGSAGDHLPGPLPGACVVGRGDSVAYAASGEQTGAD